MLSKLFRSRAKFDDPDAEIRRRAVVALSDDDVAAFQSDLAALASNDDDIGVRRAALARLTDPALLARFLDAAEPELARIAAEGIATYGTDPRRFERAEIRNAMIRIARDPEEITGLIGEVGYDSELIALAVDSKHPKVRLAVADKLANENSLIELERTSRDRDKNVNRLARTRLDAIKHARADVDKTERRAQDLIRQLEAQLKPTERDALFAAKLGVARQDWAANRNKHDDNARLLAEHGIAANSLDALQARFDELSAAADSVVVAAPVAPPTRTDDGTFGDSLRALEELLEALRAGRRDAVADYDALHAASVAQQDHWLAAADHAPPPDHLATRFHDITHTLKGVFDAALRIRSQAADIAADDIQLPPTEVDTPEGCDAIWRAQRRARHQAERLQRLLKQLDWPDGFAPPAALGQAAAKLDALAAFETASQAKLDALLEALKATIERLDKAIGDGNLATATGIEADGRRLLKSLPGPVAKRTQNEFNALAARVAELKDWVTYATHPKREELTIEMEALATAPLEPPDQADKIRALRETWKALGPVTGHADRRLLERFNAAAETAFAPCRAYFEAQAERRKFNLEQRRKICDDLTNYLDNADWSKVDWKAAERILHAARNEWRKFHPVDRSPGRKVQTRFDGLIKRLTDLVKTEWDRNVALKQAIVAEATAVRDASSDLRTATDQIKTLQRRWREIGITPRRPDQKLWREFRAVCDEVFGRRDAARVEQRQSAAAQVTTAEQLLDEYQAVFDNSGPGNADPAVARDFADRFNAIRDLPRDAQRRLEGRFRDIDKSYRVLLRQARHRRVVEGVDQLERIDAALSALEVEAAHGRTDATDIEARIAIIADLDRASPGPFTARIEKLTGASTQSLADVGEARRALTIEMEIVAGLDTPAADQQRRLALQVERLNQKHRRVLDDDPIHMAERWCQLGPVRDDDANLRARFFAACRHAIG